MRPAIPYLDPPNNQMSTAQQLALIDIECSNVARKLAINSSSSNGQLKTFLSATEGVGLDHDVSTDCALREMVKFQCMTNLKNSTTNLSHGVLKPCHLAYNKKMEWLGKSRSNQNGSLTLEFLAEYCAAVQVDLQHSLSRVIRNDKYALDPNTTYRVVRPKADKLAMLKARSRIQNMVTSGEDWNSEVNIWTPNTCVNFFVHRAPITLETEEKWRKHRESCAGPVASTSKSSGKGRGRLTRPPPTKTEKLRKISLKSPRDSN